MMKFFLCNTPAPGTKVVVFFLKKYSLLFGNLYIFAALLTRGNVKFPLFRLISTCAKLLSVFGTIFFCYFPLKNPSITAAIQAFFKENYQKNLNPKIHSIILRRYLHIVLRLVIAEKIRDLLTTKFQEETFQDCFLIEIKLHQNNKLDVFIDCDSGLTHGKCKQISRYLESTLDEKKWLGERYVLEVSSPGIGKPLQRKRQYHKNVNRKIEVTFPDGNSKTGILKKVSDDSIVVEQEIKTKEGKKKKTELVQTEILFENIKKAVVLISF